MPQYLKEYGERLVELGYRIVPLPPGSKGPHRKGWPKFNADTTQVRQWYSNGSVNDGIGVLAATAPAIDVDILDAEVAQQMSDEIDRIFEGQALMTRTGKAPKFLIPFRSDEPFRKLTSSVYTDGTNEHKVEILGDGQQWVAYHVHPETHRPYTWCDLVGDNGILDMERADLPLLARGDAQRVIDAFERIASGLVASGRWSARHIERSTPAAVDKNDPFLEHAQPAKLTDRQIDWLLSKCDASSYDDWVDVGMMLHHHYAASPESLDKWREWSSEADNFAPDQIDVKWESFGHRADRPVTFRKLLKTYGQPPVESGVPSAGFVKASCFMSAQKVEWHIKHVIPKRGLVVVYGAPGSSKSFFALDMVAHVARGIEWRGHRVRQSSVAYIAAEGVAGFGNRLAAYSRHHEVGMDEVPLFVRGGSFLLKTQTLEVIEEINALGGVGIVVIDTLAAVTPGANENTSEDMGLAIQSAQLIIEATGATVILIHHTNKGGDMRGWSGLLGAVDNQIRIERKDGLRTAHIEKQKEGEDGKAYGYNLKVVELYTDDDGDAVTSCAVEPSEDTVANTNGAAGKKKGKDFETDPAYAKARHYLSIIEQELGLAGDANLDEAAIISAIQGDETVNPLGEKDYPPKANIKRTLLSLGEKGKIRREGRWIRICR